MYVCVCMCMKPGFAEHKDNTPLFCIHMEIYAFMDIGMLCTCVCFLLFMHVVMTHLLFEFDQCCATGNPACNSSS